MKKTVLWRDKKPTCLASWLPDSPVISRFHLSWCSVIHVSSKNVVVLYKLVTIFWNIYIFSKITKPTLRAKSYTYLQYIILL